MEKIVSINKKFLKQKIKNIVLDKSKSPIVDEKTILKETLEKMVFFLISKITLNWSSNIHKFHLLFDLHIIFSQLKSLCYWRIRSQSHKLIDLDKLNIVNF